MNKEALKDCLYLLRFNYVLFEDKDEEIAQSIKKVFGKYKQMLELEEIPKKYINRVSKYIKLLNSAEKHDIVIQGRKILG